jgi:hypothetical protein
MEPLAVTRTVALPVSVEEAWRSVVDGGWLGDHVDLELLVGATGSVVEGGTVRRTVVTELDEGRAVRFVWWDEADPAVVSTVHIEVEGAAQGSTVRVTETVVGAAVACLGLASVGDLGSSPTSGWDRRLRALVGEPALTPAGV